MNPIDNIDITKKNLISGLLAVVIAGGLVACKVYHDQQPQLTEIAGAMLVVAAYAWKVPISAAGTIVTGANVTVAHADSVTNTAPPSATPALATGHFTPMQYDPRTGGNIAVYGENTLKSNYPLGGAMYAFVRDENVPNPTVNVADTSTVPPPRRVHRKKPAPATPTDAADAGHVQ